MGTNRSARDGLSRSRRICCARSEGAIGPTRRALDGTAYLREVVDEPEEDVRHREEDRDLEGYQPRRRGRSGQRRDARRQDDERERAEEERHVHVRPRRAG